MSRIFLHSKASFEIEFGFLFVVPGCPLVVYSYQVDASYLLQEQSLLN